MNRKLKVSLISHVRCNYKRIPEENPIRVFNNPEIMEALDILAEIRRIEKLEPKRMFRFAKEE